MDILRMVKTIISVLIVCLAFISCSQNKNNSEFEVTEYTDVPTIIDSPKSKLDLPDGLKYGKIVTPIFPDSMKIENNLLRQVAAYNSALLHGDVNTCGKYLYPVAFEYCKKYYPNFPDEEVMKEFFKDMSGDMQEALKTWEQNGVDFKIIVYNLSRC